MLDVGIVTGEERVLGGTVGGLGLDRSRVDGQVFLIDRGGQRAARSQGRSAGGDGRRFRRGRSRGSTRGFAFPAEAFAIAFPAAFAIAEAIAAVSAFMPFVPSAPIASAFAASEPVAAISAVATGGAIHFIAGTPVAAFAAAFALGTIGARGAVVGAGGAVIGARGAVAIIPAAIGLRSGTGSAGLGDSVGAVAGGSGGAGFVEFVNLYGLELELRGHLLHDRLFEEVDDGADFGEDVNAETYADDRKACQSQKLCSFHG
jgi:hypothetical protein